MMIDLAIQTAYQLGLYGSSARQKASGTAASEDDFLDVAASKCKEAAREVSKSKKITTESLLRAKYPNLVYNVCDASSSYWRTRNDYPHYLLYQQDLDPAELENWKPTGPNPAYADAKEIWALGNVPPGSRAVVIHPRAQERIEQDPEFAKEVAERIEAWYTFDLLRNEAIMPGCSMELSQCVAIGEDGSIVNVVTSGQPKLTYSGDPDDGEKEDFWEKRARRQTLYIRRWQEKQIAHSREISRQFTADASAQAARSKLAKMMEGDSLKKALGDTIAGVSTESVLADTRALVWGSSALPI